MRMLVSALLLLAAPAMAEPVDLPVALPDGRTLNLYCQGTAGPVVLFDAGWSADSRVWRRVMAQLPNDVRACASDRAGQGRSSPGPLPRDGAAVAGGLIAASRSSESAPAAPTAAAPSVAPPTVTPMSGAPAPLRITSLKAAAGWLSIGLIQLAQLHEDDLFAHHLLKLDGIEADAPALVAAVSEALRTPLPALPPGVLGPPRFPSGHWRRYAEALAEPFAMLRPVARRLGYPDA